MSEFGWVGQWKLAIQLAAESKKRGELTDADRRVAQAIKDRARQRQDNSVVVKQNEFLASATGLLSGIQNSVSISVSLASIKGKTK
ncbi:MAG: hypothetical protein Q9208_003494 [Pyrenodesmia sp. 3 TL-2023]